MSFTGLGCPCSSNPAEGQPVGAMNVPKSGTNPLSQDPKQQETPVQSLFKQNNFATEAESATDASSKENVSMLAVVISTVMLMASEYPKIPEEYLEYTEKYLKCIKDPQEQTPPNIEGILKHIKYLRDNGLMQKTNEQSAPTTLPDPSEPPQPSAPPSTEPSAPPIGLAEDNEGNRKPERNLRFRKAKSKTNSYTLTMPQYYYEIKKRADL